MITSWHDLELAAIRLGKTAKKISCTLQQELIYLYLNQESSYFDAFIVYRISASTFGGSQKSAQSLVISGGLFLKNNL